MTIIYVKKLFDNKDLLRNFKINNISFIMLDIAAKKPNIISEVHIKSNTTE